MDSNLLHVVTCLSNPLRWKSRIALYRNFERHMLESGVRLTIVECALGERPFELDGNTPVIFQPNNVVQTGGWATQRNPAAGGGVFAFYDNGGGSGAGLWGSMALPCQVFITIEAPLTGYYAFANQGGICTEMTPALGGGYGFATQSMPAAGGGLLAFVDPDSVPGSITDLTIYQQIAAWMPVGYIAWTQIT